MNWFSWQRAAKTGHLRIVGPIVDDAESDSLISDIERAEKVFIHTIGSPGGDALLAVRLYHVLRSRCASAVIRRADSAAFIVALSAEAIVIESSGTLMAHSVSTCTDGDVNAHRSATERLQKVNAEFIDIVSKRSRSSPDTVRAWFSGGDYRFSAQQALNLGLVDAIIDAPPTEPESQPVALLDDTERVMEALRALGTVHIRDRQKLIGRILIWAAGERSDQGADAPGQPAQLKSAAVAASGDGSAARSL